METRKLGKTNLTVSRVWQRLRGPSPKYNR
jgi:hypothetical protein